MSTSPYRTPDAPPRRRLPQLAKGELTVKTPCRVAWKSMDGDERARFCFTCRKQVYDVAAMSEDEAESFLAVHLDDADAQVRLFRRPDGRVLTTDCPVGAARRHRARAALGVAVGALAIAGVAALLGDVHLPRAHSVARETHLRFEPPRILTSAPVRYGFVPRPERPSYVPPFAPAWGRVVEADEPTLMGLPPPVPERRREARASLRQGVTTVDGNYRIEVVDRLVHQQFGRFRLCYENGLRAMPTMEGRLVIRFVIADDGALARTATELPSALPTEVAGCVLQHFAKITFPTPEHGVVEGTFTIDFRPTAPG